jgi:hypothetical protein
MLRPENQSICADYADPPADSTEAAIFGRMLFCISLNIDQLRSHRISDGLHAGGPEVTTTFAIS